MTTTAVASWLLTYLIHSTILLTGAWLISRGLGDRRLALQEIVLRAALVGGVLTAGLQIGLGIEPLAGALTIDTAPMTESVATLTAVEHTFATANFVPDVNPARAATPGGSWAVVLLTLWCFGSALALTGLGRSNVDLRRLMRTRRFRPAGRLIERLADAMGLRRKVRLSTSQAIAVPFATGIRQPEICCPERVGDLAVEHQTGLFAHELAHLARRDPAWQLSYRLGEAILVLQPLNRLVRRRLEEIAEHLTDERAVACTGDRVGLARCLVVVAHWGVSSSIGLPATSLAAGPRLDRRVRRLIAGSSDRLRLTPWVAPFAIAILIGAVSVLPGIAPAPAYAESTATGSEPVRTKTWSDADEAPSEAPPPPAVPAPAAAPEPVTAPVPEAAPAPVIAPVPEAVPVAVAPSAVKPVPESEPAPVPPIDATPPTPPTPATAPETPPAPEESAETQETEETKRQEYERQRTEERERSAREARARAEERAQSRILEYEEQARAMAEHAAQAAAKAAERADLTQVQREEMRLRAAQLAAVAEARALEASARMEDRANARSLACEARAREFTARAAELEARAAAQRQLTEEQREEFKKQIAEMRAMAEARAMERSLAAETRAREAAERARRIAERAEDERIAREKQSQQSEREDEEN